MKEPVFPSYSDPAQAASWGCYYCHTPLAVKTMQDDDYPPGRGRYSMKCPNCELRTWFDLETAQEAV